MRGNAVESEGLEITDGYDGYNKDTHLRYGVDINGTNIGVCSSLEDAKEWYYRGHAVNKAKPGDKVELVFYTPTEHPHMNTKEVLHTRHVQGRKCTYCKGVGYHVEFALNAYEQLRRDCAVCDGRGRVERRQFHYGSAQYDGGWNGEFCVDAQRYTKAEAHRLYLKEFNIAPSNIISGYIRPTVGVHEDSPNKNGVYDTYEICTQKDRRAFPVWIVNPIDFKEMYEG
jgi:hypothetical protein